MSLEEKIAEGIFGSFYDSLPEKLRPTFAEGNAELQAIFKHAAQAALSAMREEGMVVVPAEPTEAMVGNAAYTLYEPRDTHFVLAKQFYRAMIDMASRDLAPTTCAAPLASELAGQGWRSVLHSLAQSHFDRSHSKRSAEWERKANAHAWAGIMEAIGAMDKAFPSQEAPTSTEGAE